MLFSARHVASQDDEASLGGEPNITDNKEPLRGVRSVRRQEANQVAEHCHQDQRQYAQQVFLDQKTFVSKQFLVKKKFRSDFGLRKFCYVTSSLNYYQNQSLLQAEHFRPKSCWPLF